MIAPLTDIFIFALFAKKEEEVKCLEVRAFINLFIYLSLLLVVVFCFSAPLSKIFPRAVLLALAYVVLPRIKGQQRKIYVVCGILHGFLSESWQVLDSSWLFATTSCLFPTDFFFLRIGKSIYSRIIKKQTRRHQEAAGTPPRSTKTCQEVSRSVKKKKCQEYFWKFKKKILVLPDRSRILKKC